MRIAMTLGAIGLGTATAGAEIVTATYQISASSFVNSNQLPPPPPTSATVSGIYTITFDTNAAQSELVPDQVIGLDITKSNGAVIDFDETNSGVNTSINLQSNAVDMTVGGKVSTVAWMVGLSDDFRVRFRVSRVDYQVQSILENFSFVTTANAFYGAQNTTVTLLQASAGYCTAGTSASGCQASLSGVGIASATAPSGFDLLSSNVEGAKDGLYFFGTNGRQANPWGNGTSYQCVVPPVKRAGVLTGTGTNGLCDGSFLQDLNALWCPACPKPGKNPGAGATVQAQLWYRDPLSTGNQTTSLSNATEFGVGP
jgi:hypothetical protein